MVDSATLTTASGILKNNYEGPIVDQINNPNVVMALVDKNSKDIEQGAKWVSSIRMRPTQAIGARADLGTLPAAQRTLYKQPEETLKNLYGVIRVTGPLMAASKTDKGAFIKALRAESEGLTTALKLDMNRQVFGSSANDGRVAVCGTTSGSLTVQLAADTNMLYFEVGMIVDIRVISSGAAITDGDSREIESIDEANKTITLTSGNTVTTSSLHAVFREDNRNNEINGLEALISESSLHGIDPTNAGNERWKGNVKSGFGAFSSMKLQEELDKAHNRSGEWVSHIFSQHTLRNAYAAELQAMRRLVGQLGDDVKLNGGFTGLAYTAGGTEAAWAKDPFVPSVETIYAVAMKRIELKQSGEWGFIEMPGAPGVYFLPDILGSSGVDAYKAVMRKYCNLVTLKRNAHVKITGATQ